MYDVDGVSPVNENVFSGVFDVNPLFNETTFETAVGSSDQFITNPIEVIEEAKRLDEEAAVEVEGKGKGKERAIAKQDY